MSENEAIAELARRELEAVKSKDVKSFLALYANIIGGFGAMNAQFRNQPTSIESITSHMESTDYLDSRGFEELHTWAEGGIDIA